MEAAIIWLATHASFNGAGFVLKSTLIIIMNAGILWAVKMDSFKIRKSPNQNAVKLLSYA